MNLGITAGVYTDNKQDFLKEIQKIKHYGYECIDYQGFVNTDTALFEMNDAVFEAYLLEQKAMLDEVGLEVNQTHGPWRCPICDSTEEVRAERFEKMAKSIRGTAILGSRYMVIHNLMPFGKVDTDGDAVRAINREFFTRLCKVGEQYGVVICLENMPFPNQVLARPADTLAFVRELNTPWMRMCLDVGHCTRLGVSAADAVRLLGKEYLRVLHVHDNDGERDRHWLPYTGLTDWTDFSAALKEIKFDGVLSIESVIPRDLSDAERAEQEKVLFESARRIAGR